MTRARRSNVKKVDYSKEQEFSDAEDIFEDSDEEEAPQKKRGRKTKSTGTGVRQAVPLATEFGGSDEGNIEYDSRPIYTEKGYDPALPPLRERFSFLPEYEEDGSPKIELIVGRRPVGEKEEGDEDRNEKENALDENEENGGAHGRRKRGKNDENEIQKKSSGDQVEYEYLIKYKGKSYLHLEWKTGADLESMNKSAKGIYRRYLKKLAQGTDEDLENPEFDPSFALPEKVLDEADQEVSVELTDKQLLKWEKEREAELAAESDEEDKNTERKTSSPSRSVGPETEEKKEEEEEIADEDGELFCFLVYGLVLYRMVLISRLAMLHSCVGWGNQIADT